jgi:hypothetical protein
VTVHAGLTSTAVRYRYPNGLLLDEAFLLIAAHVPAATLALVIVLRAAAIGNAAALNGLCEMPRAQAVSSRSSLTPPERPSKGSIVTTGSARSFSCV